MSEVKEKHPSWFKMKIERRELVRQLSPETAVNVLLACWDYLETGEKPGSLSPIESVAFASFMPDMEEAWDRYIQRVSAKKSTRESTDIGRYHTTSVETEEETETEPEEEPEKKIERGADKPPRPPRFVPPTVDEVAAYCQERGSGIDPAMFVDFYTANGWVQARGKPIRNWKAALNTWERREKASGEVDRYADIT